MKKKRLLLITYFYGMQGSAMSEYISDRIYAFEQLGYKVDLLTSTISKNLSSENLKVVHIPSITPYHYFNEIKLSPHNHILKRILALPLVVSIGLLNQLLEKIILGRVGSGYWSWSILTTLAVFIANRVFNYELSISSGGPASAHLANILGSKFSKTLKIIELQDPLTGEGVGETNISNSFLSRFETILHKFSDQIIHINKSAYLESIRFQKTSIKYNFYYPSSRNFNITNKDKIIQDKITFVHMGSLYSSRNLNNLLTALSKLDFSKLRVKKIVFWNIGNVENIFNYDIKTDNFEFLHIPTLNRVEALNKASEADVLFLVQHLDKRSNYSFPYKLWDYLNLEIPILSLHNNLELHEMLTSLGHFSCDASDTDLISQTLNSLLETLQNNNTKYYSNINLIDQMRLFLTLCQTKTN